MTIENRHKRRLDPVVVYLLLTSLICSLWWWLISVRGGFGQYFTWLMWSPAIAAAITLRATGGSLSELGLVGAPLRLLMAAALTPWLYLASASLAAYAIGVESLETPERLAQYAVNLGFAGMTGIPLILVYAFVSGLAGTISAAANALGEEIGWRGFLFPRLASRFGFLRGTIATGLIWSLWHFPLPLLRPDFESSPSEWIGLVGFTLTLVLSSFVYSYFRVRTGSVWTAAAIHAGHNGCLGMIGRLTADHKPAAPIYYYTGEEGALTVGFALIVAVLFYWLYRRDKAAGRLVENY